ncbi:MAG: branched-chain amino acid ABC transporter permease [Gammaproteobacteria bacterium]|nr:branched-chain amino acid ABC transporter permease [Gammaproteobacteria bacterium]NIR88863.1 branched-chain amino acid ABC transporter permease [Gammaproteobacteria bacterium]NIU06467.1 branched-chain amino acid ABC transporter permease [Gammaproteobacteria bacterium]NIV53359.1 branched-chain amino acid ABC transporter permease [Gammaproteobacteria bacterium]NIV74078.1 branched-chain amino acid ABC transporter permease [Gammaproteobacteria bacterium]
MLSYSIAIVTFMAIYGMIGLGLNLQWGLTGLINLGQVAFFAVGAYTTALLCLAGVAFPIGILSSAALSGTLAVAVALITPRLRDDYLAIVTLGFAELVRLIFLNEQWIARGPDGLSAIPRPLEGVWPHNYELSFMILSLIALALIFWLARRVASYPFGRTLRAIREDETVVTSLGKNVLRFKVQIFGIGAAMAGIAGAFYATYLTFIAPPMFTALVSINVLVAVLIGGQGSNVGVLWGTLIVALLLEGTRFLKDYITLFSGVELAALRLMLIGVLLIVLVLVRFRDVSEEE